MMMVVGVGAYPRRENVTQVENISSGGYDISRGLVNWII